MMDSTELLQYLDRLSIHYQRHDHVAVYTSERAGMLEIVNGLLSAGFDPETVEPDILCLARFFQQCFVTPGSMRPLFVVFGEKTCYILSFNDAGHPRVRSFVLSASATKTQTLSREIPLTIAAMNTYRRTASLRLLTSHRLQPACTRHRARSSRSSGCASRHRAWRAAATRERRSSDRS